MNKSLDLRRNRRVYALLGSLAILIAVLMLVNPDRSWGKVVFGAFFVFGGLISIGYINRLVVNKSTNDLLHQQGLVIPLRTRSFSLGKVKAVKVSKKKRGSGERARTTFPVRLRGIRGATVLDHSNPWFSRVVAEQLARLIGVPLINSVYGKTTTRPVSELDLPLINRWIRDGRHFEPPALHHDSDLKETAGHSSYELTIEAEWPQLKYLVGCLFFLVIPAVIDIGLTEFFHSWAYRMVAVFFFVGGVMSLALIGRSKLAISPNEITFRQGYFPRAARLAIKDIEELVVASDGITLVGDTKALWVHWGRSKADSQYLEAVVPYQLLRIGRSAVQLGGAA